ncbi:MAG: hypothetical protein ACHQ50_12770 [Fimbriimonadales bacterium]
MIQDAKVLVAELTEKNANVFYELGLAHAIGKPVVLVADNIGDVPFDLQPLRVIVYDKNDPAWGTQLRANITAFLEETLADPASAVPSMFRKVVKSQAPAEGKADFRISMLERQVAALSERGERVFAARIRSPGALYRRLRMARSRADAVSAVREAMMGGVSRKLIVAVIREAIPGRSEGRAVLSEAGLPMDL